MRAIDSAPLCDATAAQLSTLLCTRFMITASPGCAHPCGDNDAARSYAMRWSHCPINNSALTQGCQKEPVNSKTLNKFLYFGRQACQLCSIQRWATARGAPGIAQEAGTI